jgi:steroid delta-isomerase-like uncharacterized protein
MLEIIRKHLAACSAASWDEYRATLSSEAVYEEVSSLRRVVGVERCVTAVQRWKTAFPDLKATVTRGYTVGDRVIVEVEWEGTHTGPLEGSFGTVAPTHRHCQVHGVVLFTLKNAKIVETRNYFDVMTVLTQLGVSPKIGTVGAHHTESARL